jgi:hypothetical protein
MLSALLYLQFYSFKNRLVSRFKRLRQPKYLVGGIVGFVYFYFYFVRYLFGFGGTARQQSLALSAFASPENLALYESLGALALFLIVFMAWFVPHERAALTFTEAEIAFLFPAPISRRGLIHFKLLRSQVRIFFTTCLLTLVTNRYGGHAWIRAAGWWLILSTLNLHFLGCSFARTLLLDRGITNWQRRIGVILVAGILIFSAAFWARHTLPAFNRSRMNDLDAIKAYVEQVLDSGPAPYLLAPFRLMVRPYLAPNGVAFLKVLLPMLLLLGLHYAWVVQSNVAFEEASLEASRRHAERVATIRSGNWQSAQPKRKAKRPPFVLSPMGPQPVALLWKNLISVGHGLTVRLWISLAAVAIAFSIGLQPLSSSSGISSVLGLLACILIIWSLILGPQLLRQDFRQDLLLADVLKSYPMRGWQIALGEILAPAAVLTGFQWFLLIVALGLLWNLEPLALEKSLRLSIGIGTAVLIPVLNFITLQVPNAAVLLFPAWFQASKEGAQGIEATGQRLIFLLGQLLAFFLTLLPAVVVFLVVLFLGKFALGLVAAVPLASVAAAVVLGGEAALGLMLLGWLFERFDVSAELNP